MAPSTQEPPPQWAPPLDGGPPSSAVCTRPGHREPQLPELSFQNGVQPFSYNAFLNQLGLRRESKLIFPFWFKCNLLYPFLKRDYFVEWHVNPPNTQSHLPVDSRQITREQSWQDCVAEPESKAEHTNKGLALRGPRLPPALVGANLWLPFPGQRQMNPSVGPIISVSG